MNAMMIAGMRDFVNGIDMQSTQSEYVEGYQIACEDPMGAEEMIDTWDAEAGIEF